MLLPGITALVGWNIQGASQGAKRPELQLSSINALFVALLISIIMHVIGYGLVSLFWSAAVELGHYVDPLGPLIQSPYEMAIAISFEKIAPSSGAIEAFLIVVLLECLLAWRLISSRGLDLTLDGFDSRSQGWVFQHVVRPIRHGYTPIAYVLTTSTHGEYGIGYEGIVADIRQGDNGELKAVSLAEPQRFVFRIVPVNEGRPRRKPHFQTYEREWIGGVVALDGSVIRNIVIHTVWQELLQEIENIPVSPDEKLVQPINHPNNASAG
ncbi:MAG: hypothetical protein HEQ21_08180 [Blastomonas sp.]|jgi:hypothetical protein|uniref:hypothetical protein n=1 Tax=Blastomonas sp. TaxID=1909299 RepID=UPI002586A989|nr:hypothetical protein [Blastomonas sp.]MCO5792783.1 hypothetical protein [Blastomonas sp.]